MRFLASVLSGNVFQVNDSFQCSQFMKLVIKGVLRDSVKNIIAFNNLGSCSQVQNLHGQKTPVVPFSHQVQKFQRFLLYCGIKTKNSKGVECKDLQGYLEYSDSCMEIIDNLQKMRHDPNMTLDKIKVILQDK